MGNRAVQLATLLVAVVLGLGTAYGVRALRTGGQQATSTSPSSTTASPAPAGSPSAAASPQASATPSASPAPGGTEQPPGGAGPGPGGTSGGAALPPQILAGSTYRYSGVGTLALLAQDSVDSGTSICAAINRASLGPPAGYLTGYFVSVTFRDGNVLASGYVQTRSGSNDFGSIQNAAGKQGIKSAATAPGAHTYCVTRSASGWTMTSDGSAVFSTAGEPAATTAGATLRFESTIQRVDSSQPVVAQTFVVPGFSALTVDGRAPAQLQGFTRTF